MHPSIKGKVTLITGSGKGIGKAMALAFAQAGADVVIADKDAVAGERTSGAIEAEGKTKPLMIRVDVCDSDQVDHLVDKTLATYGRIDILVNNAGGGYPTVPLLQMQETEWDRIVTLNLKSVFLCCKAVGQVMVRQRSGNIINMTSVVALGPFPMGANYSAAKAGVKNLTETLAVELAPFNIRVNALAPGPVETPLTREFYEKNPQMKEQRVKAIPLKRLGKPEDVADAALFLAGDASCYITGQTIVINGGFPTFVTPELISSLSKIQS
jgi:3-oxoacyl-[acyl-carrier protein] reductase